MQREANPHAAKIPRKQNDDATHFSKPGQEIVWPRLPGAVNVLGDTSTRPAAAFKEDRLPES